MAQGFILYQNGYYILPNEVACCSRLSGDQLKLLALIANRVNNAGNELKMVVLPKLLLKRVFENSVDRTIKNNAKRLKELGFIDSYSMKGGASGEFVFIINDRPENNPYVLMSRIENDVISHTELQSGQDAESLLKAFTAVIQAEEHEYASKIMNAAENERGAILSAYDSFLREALLGVGNVSVTQSKPKPKKGKQMAIETALPEDVQSWSYPEFARYFLQLYARNTGRKHSGRNREGKTVEDCIKDLQHHYRDKERAEQKPKMKKHIEAFFDCYNSKKLDPKAFFMADCDVLCNVERYLEDGQKPIVYEERTFKKGKSQLEIRAQQAREAKQEYLGLSIEELMARRGL